MDAVLAHSVAKMGRRLRRPSHSFHLRTRAFQIQPFCIAPVLAGETLKNALLQARVVTDPIKNPLIGWWKEYYLFYVSFTALEVFMSAGMSETTNSEDHLSGWIQMLLAEPSFVTTQNDYSADKTTDYAVAGQQHYLETATEMIVNHYFRDELDRTTSYVLDNVPMAMINNTGILDSAILDSNFEPVDATVDVDLLGDATDATLTVSEIELALQRYQLAKVNGLTTASWEDYLASFGVKTKAPEPEKPELIRYVREWQYPSNTVEPTTGVPSSAVSWSIQERADKDRFFKSPGFIVGLTVARPKVYLSNQKSHLAGWLDRAEDWLPNILNGNLLATFKKYAGASGPFSATTNAYWLDVKDLYLYGDQFVNFALTETDAGLVALPTSGLQKKFPSDTDIDALFVTPATKQWIREDGRIDLTIAGSQRDISPTT